MREGVHDPPPDERQTDRLEVRVLATLSCVELGCRYMGKRRGRVSWIKSGVDTIWGLDSKTKWGVDTILGFGGEDQLQTNAANATRRHGCGACGCAVSVFSSDFTSRLTSTFRAAHRVRECELRRRWAATEGTVRCQRSSLTLPYFLSTSSPCPSRSRSPSPSSSSTFTLHPHVLKYVPFVLHSPRAHRCSFAQCIWSGIAARQSRMHPSRENRNCHAFSMMTALIQDASQCVLFTWRICAHLRSASM